ncbi:MAG: hypothetical protein WCR06_06215, partial [bacterium]
HTPACNHFDTKRRMTPSPNEGNAEFVHRGRRRSRPPTCTPALHGLFLKRSGILTTKDPKSTKFNKSDGFDYFQRPIT